MRKQDRVLSLFLAVVVLATTACAGADLEQREATAAPQDAEAGSIEPDETDAKGAEGTAAGDDAPIAAEGDSTVRRDLGLALRPESDVATNLLPPVEVHDVGQDRMVNFKNIFPAERPVLLWMWAPY